MPKQYTRDTRVDFSGGLNTTAPLEQVRSNELLTANNVRPSREGGTLVQRTGTRRAHASAVVASSTITGVFQWDYTTSAKQVVAVCNGNLFYTNTATLPVTFTTVAASFSTTAAVQFATFRANSSGASLILFMGDGTSTYKWTGATLTKISGTNSVPAADLIKPYHTRMFYRNPNFKKHVFWSKVGDAEECTINVATDGGQAFVDVLSGEALTAFEVIGNSLLLATEDCVMRFTGYSSDDIQIAQDTEGVASEVGVLNGRCLTRFENAAAGLTTRGPYVFTEGGAIPIGQKVLKTFVEDISPSTLASAIVAYHRGRRELWYILKTSASTPTSEVMVYNIGTQAWYRFSYGFLITSVARYEKSTGEELLIAGCNDGFVRLLDDQYVYTTPKDDVLSDGTGGNAIESVVTIGPFLNRPIGSYKLARRFTIQYDSAYTASSTDPLTVTVRPVDAELKPYVQSQSYDFAGAGGVPQVETRPLAIRANALTVEVAYADDNTDQVVYAVAPTNPMRNYDPQDASVLEISMENVATNLVCEGFSGGTDGRQLLLISKGNPGTPVPFASFILSHEDTDTTAANRITSPTGANIQLRGPGAALLEYDGTTSRWIVIGTTNALPNLSVFGLRAITVEGRDLGMIR